MIKKKSRNSMRTVRHERIRSKLMGTSTVPRLCVFRSNTGIYAQIIDDETRTTLVSASSLDKDLKIKTEVMLKQLKLLVKQLLKKQQKQKLQKWYLIEEDTFIMDV